MSGSINKVILVGRLARDPEARTMGSGDLVVNLTVATSDTWKDRQTGEKKERSEFHRVVIFNESLCKVAQNYLKKGSTVYIEGQMQSRKYTDSQGVERTVWELVLQQYRGELTMLGGRGEQGGESHSENHGGTPAQDPLDDEIPF